MYFFILCFSIVIVLLIIIYLQFSNGMLEGFENENKIDNNNKLLIKKTRNYTKMFESSKYCVWMPKPINDYYPIGEYITLNKKKPKTPSLLVKNEVGIKSNDKPVKYEIISITNNNWAIWKPIADKNYTFLGHIHSKDYPSKYLIRCVKEKYCKSTYPSTT